MSAHIEEVTVVPYGSRFAIQSKDGEFFYTIKEEVRTFIVPSDATYFLRGVCEGYSGVGYIVRLPSGRTKYLGTAMTPEEEGKFGPHEWNKVNLVTISDSSGMYDIVRCPYCGKEVKCYGFSRPSKGTCKKNPLKEV